MRLLIVEDEKKLCDTVAKAYMEQAMRLIPVMMGTRLWIIFCRKYDLIVLGPQSAGYGWHGCIAGTQAEMRETKVLVPVCQSQIADKVEGLDAGANDYMEKPFHLQELEARIRSPTRRKFVQKECMPSLRGYSL